MPRVTSNVTGGATAANGSYPKLLQGKSGSVWLITAPKTGVIVHLSNRPQKTKHKLGYYSTRMMERDMSPFTGKVELALAA